MQLKEYLELYSEIIFSTIKIMIFFIFIGLVYYLYQENNKSKYELRIEKLSSMQGYINGKIINISPLEKIHSGTAGYKREVIKYRVKYYFELNYIKYESEEIFPINLDFNKIIAILKSKTKRDSIPIKFITENPSINLINLE